MDLGGLVDFLEAVFAVSAFAALLLSLVAAAYGTRHGATVTRKVSAILTGFLSGVAVAAIVGFVLISLNSLTGLVLGPLVGGAVSYGIARSEASWTKHSWE
jgi:Na+-translocating ferredoxin:NAD+ oxidoreductase RnfD subunit